MMRLRCKRKIMDYTPTAYTFNKRIFDSNKKLSDLKLIEVNPAFEKTLGFLKADVIGKPVSSWMFENEQEKAKWLSVFSKVQAKTTLNEFEETITIKDNIYTITVFAPCKKYL